MYHVWKYGNKRRTGLLMVTRKGASRWDDDAGPASGFWATRDAAHKWATKNPNIQFGFKVLKCDGADCPMKSAH